MSKIFIIFLLLIGNSCVDNITNHGIKPTEKNLAKIDVGVSKKMIVKGLLGPATIESNRNGIDVWYYISYEKNKRPLKLANYVSHNIIEMEFEGSRLVKLTKYDKSHLNKIAYNENKTLGREDEKGILRQLLGNIGRFDGSNDL